MDLCKVNRLNSNRSCHSCRSSTAVYLVLTALSAPGLLIRRACSIRLSTPVTAGFPAPPCFTCATPILTSHTGSSFSNQHRYLGSSHLLIQCQIIHCAMQDLWVFFFLLACLCLTLPVLDLHSKPVFLDNLPSVPNHELLDRLPVVGSACWIYLPRSFPEKLTCFRPFLLPRSSSPIFSCEFNQEILLSQLCCTWVLPRTVRKSKAPNSERLGFFLCWITGTIKKKKKKDFHRNPSDLQVCLYMSCGTTWLLKTAASRKMKWLGWFC